ncbi:MAG: hypothetical protein D6683_09720 [Actinomyces sp.]|nr:MAG: hypothetical protein D6683_09720 [Actinomyces sp.]
MALGLVATACGSASPELTQVVEQADGDPTPRDGTPDLPSPGGGGDPLAAAARNPKAFVLGSTEKTAREGESAHMSMSFTLTGMPDVGEVSFTVEGASDSDGNSWFRMDFGSLLEAAGAAAAEDPSVDAAGLEAFAAMFAEPFEVRHVDGVSYVSASLFSFLFPVDTPWIAIPDDEEASPGVDTMSVDLDPTQFLDLMRGVGADIEVVGTETLDGVTTVHLSGTLSMADALRLATPEERQSLEESFSGFDPLGTLGSLDDAVFDLDVWIDGDGRLRRFVLGADDLSRFDPTGQTPPGAGLRLEFSLGGFGEPVTVEVPPPDQVTSIDDIDPFGLGGG